MKKMFHLNLVTQLVIATLVIATNAFSQGRIIGGEPIGAKLAIPVLYATDRSARGGNDHRAYFGSERGALQYGICKVGIPPSHRVGVLEAPGFWKFWQSWDASRDIVFSSLELHDEFATAWNRALGARTLTLEDHIFVFVHGYGNTFQDSCRRTAQMWHDLNLSGIPVMYSWPSAGSLYAFDGDLAVVQESSTAHFSRFLSILGAQARDKRIHLITHSMGSRLLMHSLAEAGKRSDTAAFDQVALFAPELPSKILQDLAPNARRIVRRITLYGSREDEALRIAREFYGADPRSGDLNLSAMNIPNLEVVDATAVNFTMSGHTYYADNRSVISEMRDLIRGVAIEARGELQKNSLGYWELRP